MCKMEKGVSGCADRAHQKAMQLPGEGCNGNTFTCNRQNLQHKAYWVGRVWLPLYPQQTELGLGLPFQ